MGSVYLLDHFAQGTTLVPPRYKPNEEGQVGGETEEWMRYRHYMHYSEGSLMPVLVIGILMSALTSPSIPFFIRPLTGLVANKVHSAFLNNEYATHLSFLESQIKTSSGKYLCGDHLTAADIIMSFPLIAAREKSGVFTKEGYPELMAYLERLESEEGYKKAVDIVVEREGEFIAI
ncbi:bifunctional glutathione transferase/peroxidase [Clarireedia jacksonii]